VIVKRWISSPTIAPNAGTRWAAYNAVTEYVDHYSKVRGGDDQSARALRAVTIGSTAQATEGQRLPDTADALIRAPRPSERSLPAEHHTPLPSLRGSPMGTT
jgi:hypothetical protein